MESILETASLVKYILIGIGVIGFIVLLMGLIKREGELVKRAVYLIVAAIALYIAGSFVLRKTEEKAMNYAIEQYSNENEYTQ